MEQALEEKCKDMSRAQIVEKCNELALEISAHEQSVERMESLVTRLAKIEGDISYHKGQLKILRKLKRVAESEGAALINSEH